MKTFTLILLSIFSLNTHAANTDFLKDLSKTQFCKKAAGVGILPFGVESLKVTPLKDESKLSPEMRTKKLLMADMPMALLEKHKELCTDGSIQTSAEYMSKLHSECAKACKSNSDCHAKCADISETQTLFMSGVAAGKANCYAKPASKSSTETKAVR